MNFQDIEVEGHRLGTTDFMAFFRKVRIASWAMAVHIPRKQNGKIIKFQHLGSTYTNEELDILVALEWKY
jgi:hypothetical protein